MGVLTRKTRFSRGQSECVRLIPTHRGAAHEHPLDPIVSEFETQEQADSYQRWFRERVQASLADPRPGIPHDEVMAEMDALINDIEVQHRKRA